MIYVVGSLNTDMSASLERFPEAGETVAAKSVLISPGGKGANQATAVAKLGGECVMIGKTGNDAFGAAMKNNLISAGVNAEHVTKADCSSGLAMILVHEGNNRIVLDGGANLRLSEQDVDRGLSAAKAGDVLMLQLEVPLNIVAHALETGKRKGMITMLNPAPAVELTNGIYENAEIITPNETETEILTGIKPDCEVNIALAVKKFRSFGARNIIITLGEAGSAVAVGNEITLLPAIKVKAVDTTAAGDTFVGATALKMHGGEDIVSAARFATAASALKVTRRGAAAAIPALSEVEEFIKAKKREEQGRSEK